MSDDSRRREPWGILPQPPDANASNLYKFGLFIIVFSFSMQTVTSPLPPRKPGFWVVGSNPNCGIVHSTTNRPVPGAFPVARDGKGCGHL
jgi:hypothetical protein